MFKDQLKDSIKKESSEVIVNDLFTVDFSKFKGKLKRLPETAKSKEAN